MCSKYAQIIYLADRTDILINSNRLDPAAIKAAAGDRFNPDYVDALLCAEKKYSVSDKIVSEEYRNEIGSMLKSLDIATDDIMDYLKLLVCAIDFRSPYTVTHTADTTIISLETARLLGLNKRDMQMLYIGAFLHDIGKIAIPHDILEKPGKLTIEEFDIVKEHIAEGEVILRGVVSDEICDIAMRHHEKLDGSGYPLGLTSEELTLPQRIVAVADIFSALSQRRSYKDPFSKDKVVSILTGMRDQGLLCSVVVDTMCENYDMIMEKTERSHDPVNMMYENLLKEYSQRCKEFGYGINFK